MAQPAAARAPAADFIPDFCRGRPLLLLGVTLELFAVVLTLAGGAGELGMDAVRRFLLISVFLLWIGFCSAAALCAGRRLLHRVPVPLMFALSWALLVAIIGLISLVGYEILLRSDIGFATTPEPRYVFMFRQLIVGAVVALLVLQYFWLRHQWRQGVMAEGEARYQALQARIRPHFLFNSLNSIAALIGSRPAEAEEMIEDVAELLRAGLDARSRLVPLADELALSRAYLRIEQARLGDRLAVDWDVPESIAGSPVPLLSVQPLVENAVYHGIERLPGPGRISIRAQATDGGIAIEVGNPRVPPDVALRSSGQRIAVDNIAQRLSLIYGEGQARLTLGEVGDRYVSRLELPRVKES